MDTSNAHQEAAGGSGAAGGWVRSVAIIVIFDVAGPLAAYNLLRSAGLTAVTALALSGVFPALAITVAAVRKRHLDVVGVLVLAGIVVGALLGVVSHSARLMLVEGSVPTVVFGVACLGSLRGRHPLMYSFAREFAGPQSAKGREMARLWQYDGFRRVFRTITVVWGTAFLIEAALRAVIVFRVSIATAQAISKVTPFVFFGLLSAWTVGYGTYRRKKGERMAALAGEVPEAAAR